MLVRKLVGIDHEDFGRGWAPSWLPDPQPTGNLGHDLFDHVQLKGIDTFSYEGEMVAFGAMHYTRQFSDWGMAGCIENAQMSGIAYFFRELAYEQRMVKPIKGKRPRHCGVGSFSANIMFGEIESLLETGDLRGELGDSSEGTLEWVRENANLNAERMVDYMQLGYNYAAHKYGKVHNLSQWAMPYLYGMVNDEFNRYTRHTPEEGDVLIVRVDYENQRVRIERSYAEE